nr:helix-turn-helix transcriptional regulator [Limosilactobacillus mucosae]
MEKINFPRNRIKKMRTDLGLTQAQLAEKTGLSMQAISSYENNKRNPKEEVWWKLSDFFGVPPSYLQGIADDKNGWMDWEQATGYSKDRLEKEIKYLVDTGRLDENADLQAKIGRAVKSLDNDSMDSEVGVKSQLDWKIRQLSSEVLDAFYQQRPKGGNNSLDLKSGMTEETLNKITDILNQARWDIAKIPVHFDGHNPEPYDPDKHKLK